METQASPYPTLTIGEKFKDIVRDYEFDKKFCADYLFDRGAPPKQIASLEIHIDDCDKESVNKNCSGNYSYNLFTSNPTINLIPKLPWACDYHKQGDLIRHETEHFIYGLTKTPKLLTEYLLINGVNVAAMSILRPNASYGIQALVPLMTALHFYYVAYDNEKNAQRAESERRIDLPDRVLRVDFDVDALRELRHSEGISCSSNCVLRRPVTSTDGIIGSCIR